MSDLPIQPAPSHDAASRDVGALLALGPTADPGAPMQLALEQTLSIATARTDSDVLGRTLTAASEISGARVCVAVAPDGSLRMHGAFSAELTRTMDLALTNTGPTHLAPTTDLAKVTDPAPAILTPKLDDAELAMCQDQLIMALVKIGLPDSRTAWLGETMIVVAAPDHALLPQASSLLALIVELAATTLARLRELDQLSRQADSDPLTGLRHTRPFTRQLNASSPGRTAVIAVDVDDFKRINDEFGHQAGDHALISVVEALRSAMRGDDQLYRIGGDEFAVIVDVNSPAEVVAIAGRLLEAARKTGQTVSVGAALHMVGETGRDTLGRADKALYQAKRAGRDTARLAPTQAKAAA